MKNRTVLIATAVIVLGLLIASLIFVFKIRSLRVQLAQTGQLASELQRNIDSISEIKDKLTTEKERLQADAVSYIALNAKLQKEKEKLQDALDSSQRTIQAKEADLQRSRQKMEKLEKKITKTAIGQKGKYAEEKNALEEKITTLQTVIQEEKAGYHYNLAVAYTQANLYDEAIATYERSLELKPDNPEAHFNLGLLYDNVKQEREKAIEHYRAYLRLKPDAADKEEIESWITELK